MREKIKGGKKRCRKKTEQDRKDKDHKQEGAREIVNL